MFKLFVLVVAVGGALSEESDTFLRKTANNVRQKRLLFYDEEGNLVKTFSNQRLYDFNQQSDKIPYFGNFWNYFSFLRPSNYASPMTFMIPVSNAVLHRINTDPLYQNKLLISPKTEAVIEPNPLCAGKRTQIPSPKNCNSFLNCWDGWAFLQECPEGLRFSNEGYCDYPDKVDCNNRRIMDPPRPQMPQCSQDFEVFRNELQCNEFFVCVNRQPIKFQCPTELAYSQVLGVCDYPSKVDCNASLAIPTSPSSGSSGASESNIKPSSEPSPTSPGFKTVVLNSIYNTETWSKTNFAVSRQDAIRQLQLGQIANVKTT